MKRSILQQKNSLFVYTYFFTRWSNWNMFPALSVSVSVSFVKENELKARTSAALAWGLRGQVSCCCWGCICSLAFDSLIYILSSLFSVFFLFLQNLCLCSFPSIFVLRHNGLGMKYQTYKTDLILKKYAGKIYVAIIRTLGWTFIK